jgi:hypothetical protein
MATEFVNHFDKRFLNEGLVIRYATVVNRQRARNSFIEKREYSRPSFVFIFTGARSIANGYNTDDSVVSNMVRMTV